MRIIFDESESAAPLPVVEAPPEIIEEDIEEDYEDKED
jgi:hypothetical protein